MSLTPNIQGDAMMSSYSNKRQRNAEFGNLVNQLNQWQIPDRAIDTVHDLARISLNEVKALTEYEDGKVSRLLTVVAFLSAVGAAVFTRLATEYAIPSLASYCLTWDWWLPWMSYLFFFLYVSVVSLAVLIMLGAIKPTFNVPATWKGPAKTGLPTSMIFYKNMLDVTAPKWGEAFAELSGDDGKPLKSYYAKCYIGEAYLVAQKAADKLRVVSPGVMALQWAMAILLIFFWLFACTVQFVAPANH
jgi:hypothetical protein